jgi:pilus assembly protein CpaB
VELTGNRYKGDGGLRKLLSTRRGTALAAGACAIVAAGVLLFAAAQYRHSVSVSNQPENVLVATSLIQKGTPANVISTGGMFRLEKILPRLVSGGAIADVGLVSGKVAARDISPGQQLTLSDFTTGDGYISQLGPADRAISIPLDASHGLTGVVHAGDRVDVYAGINASVNGGAGSANAGVALRLLLPNVLVLAANQNSNGGGVGGGSGVNSLQDVILKVRAADAGALAFASDNGKVWLILRGANATEARAQKQAIYTLNSVLLGSKPVGGGAP